MSLRLSIIVPFYNVEQYIAECLDSLYRQDLPENEFEVICVDDCSPDNTIDIVSSYAKKHDNLKIVKNKLNRKLGGARNAGMEVASGNYVLFVDSDDFIEDNILKTLCTIAENDNLDVLHFNYDTYPIINNSMRRVESLDVMTGPELFFDERFIWYHDLVTAWRKIYKRSFLIDNKITFAEQIMFEDVDYALRVFAKAKRVRHIGLIGYKYRFNENSITRIKHNSQHIRYWVKLCERFWEMKSAFVADGADSRFQDCIDSFIKHQINRVLNEYSSLEKKEKKESHIVIKAALGSPLGKYVSQKKRLRFVFGLL